jgi:hypothetical protein
LSLVPEGASLTYETQSAFLVKESDTLMQWKSTGYNGLDRDERPEVWSPIMRTVEDGSRRVQIQLGESASWPEFKEPAMLYSKKQVLGLSLDAHTSPVPPWD